MSVSPVILKVPGRTVDLEIKVTALVSGENLPIILLSHGHGGSNFLSSFKGYAPMVDFYASNGFVVIQPTHQDSKMLALDTTGPERAFATAACRHIRKFAINYDAHVDGHYAPFVVFLLSDVKKQMEITFHNYKLKKVKQK